MIPQNIASAVTVIGNDTTGLYNFPFRIEAETDLMITIVEEATGTSEEYLGGVSPRFECTEFSRFPLLGGSIQLLPFTPVPGELEYLDIDGFLKSGFSAIIAYRTIASQPTNYVNTNNATPINMEKSLDRLTMSIKAAINLANSALRFAAGEAGNPVFPPLLGNEDRGVYVNSDASGFTYGPTVNQIQGLVDAAAASAVDASNSATDSANSATASENSAIASDASAVASQASADAAALSATAASDSAVEAQAWSEESEAWSKRTLFTALVEVDFSDSPINLTNADKDKMYLVDSTLGAVVFNLPLASAADPDFKIGLVKVDASANTITINNTGADTINGGASMTVSEIDFGVVVFSNFPSTDWTGRYFVKESAVISGGGGGFTVDALQTIATAGQLAPVDADQFVVPVIGDAAGENEITGAIFSSNPRAGAMVVIRGTSSVNIVVIRGADVAGGAIMEDFYATAGATLTLYWDAVANRFYQLSRRDAE